MRLATKQTLSRRDFRHSIARKFHERRTVEQCSSYEVNCALVTNPVKLPE